MGPEPQPILMPAIVGQELSEAERALNNLGIKLNLKIEEEHHDEVAKGKVIRTEPAAETELTTDQEIKIFVSLGMEHKTGLMLDVVGYEKADAETALKDQQMNLDLVFEEVYDSTVEAGYVIRTEPEADKEIETGDQIKIYISKGAQMVPLSNVLNLNVDSAVNILKSDGFVLYTIETVEDVKQKDTVIELRVDGQTVSPGDKIDVAKTVTIVVSLGSTPPREVTKNVVIDLKGMANEAECEVRITRNNEVVFEQTVPVGTASVTLENQTGSGKQTYMIIIDDLDGWMHEEDFS